MLSRQIVRGLMTSAVRQSAHGPTGPGSNIPFSIKSKGRLAVMFVLFFGSGMSVPFIAVRHQLTK